MRCVCLFILCFVVVSFGQNITSLSELVIEHCCPYRDLYGISPFCTNATQAKSSGIQQLPVLIGVGWDPVKGQIGLPFFEMTYEKNITYTSNSGQIYVIPDQVTFTPKNVSVNYDTFVSTYQNISAYVEDISLTRENITSGIFSLPMDAGAYMIAYFDQGNNNIYLTTKIHLAYELEFTNISNLQIIPAVQKAIDSLPETYNEDIYNLFISYWGTHIVLNGYAGGLAQQTVMTRVCYGGLDLDDQAELYMLKSLYAQQYQNVNFESGFTQYSSAGIINMYGGNPTFVEYSQWNERVASYEDYPVLTRVVVVPITDFISNASIKANMEQAVSAYLGTEQTSRTQLLNSWLSQINGARSISWVPAFYAPPDTNYQGQLVAVSSYAKSVTLGENQGTGGTISCNRDDNGLIYAINNTPDSSTLTVQIRTGTSQRVGCSYTQFYEPPCQGCPYGMTFQNLCCQGCIPSVSGELVSYVGGRSYPEPGTGLFSCTCPTI